MTTALLMTKMALALSSLTFLGSALADTPAPAIQACDAMASSLPELVFSPHHTEYVIETSRYWSTRLREAKPACVVLADSSDSVSAAVKVLNQYPEVQFAVKSGGHDPNVGHNSVQDGVLIAFDNMVGATYDESTKLAHVRPGGEWNDVIGDLEPYGVTVVGGRLGIVGVAGLLLQGGISFLSAQYGLAADNVVGWETVMANGSVVNIDAQSQPDLAVALKGSGSQFGIVTRFSITTHPIGDVWGGFRLYDESQVDKIYAALHDFVPNGPSDPKHAVIVSSLILGADLSAFIVYYFYDGPEPPADGPLADFLEIPALVSLTSQQSYSSLLKSNGAPAKLQNARQSFRTYTLPYIASNPTMYLEIRDQLREIASEYFSDLLHLVSQCSVDFQPLPSVVGRQSEAQGGNSMGLKGDDGDRVIVELQCSWLASTDDEVQHTMSKSMTDWLDERVMQWLESAGIAGEVYLPLFMNDAAADQNVTGSYSEYTKLKALQREVDPNGLFSRRAGGFKY